jgi:hypothetical protein
MCKCSCIKADCLVLGVTSVLWVRLTVQIAVCRLIGVSGILSKVVDSLACTQSERLAVAQIRLLLCCARHHANAQLLLEHTSIFGTIALAMKRCHSTMHSELTPLALDLMWDLAEIMPMPRRLVSNNSQVHVDIVSNHMLCTIVQPCTSEKSACTCSSEQSKRCLLHTHIVLHQRNTAGECNQMQKIKRQNQIMLLQKP